MRKADGWQLMAKNEMRNYTKKQHSFSFFLTFAPWKNGCCESVPFWWPLRCFSFLWVGTWSFTIAQRSITFRGTSAKQRNRACIALSMSTNTKPFLLNHMKSSMMQNAAARISRAKYNSLVITFFHLKNNWLSIYNPLFCPVWIWRRCVPQLTQSSTTILHERRSCFFPGENGLCTFLRWSLILWFSEIIRGSPFGEWS